MEISSVYVVFVKFAAGKVMLFFFKDLWKTELIFIKGNEAVLTGATWMGLGSVVTISGMAAVLCRSRTDSNSTSLDECRVHIFWY